LQLPGLVVVGRMWGHIIEVWQCWIRNGKLVEGVMPWQRTTTMLQNGKRHHECQFYVGKLWGRQGNSKGCKGNDGNVKAIRYSNITMCIFTFVGLDNM